MSHSHWRAWTCSLSWLKTVPPRRPTMTCCQSSVTTALPAVSGQICHPLAHTQVSCIHKPLGIFPMYSLGLRCSNTFPSLIPGGHYIAYCRNDLNNLWYEFDDQSVTEVSESCVQNAEAYVLFYK